MNIPRIRDHKIKPKLPNCEIPLKDHPPVIYNLIPMGVSEVELIQNIQKKEHSDNLGQPIYNLYYYIYSWVLVVNQILILERPHKWMDYKLKHAAEAECSNPCKVDTSNRI